MNFKDIGITDRKAKQFIDAGIETPMDLVNYWPKKYIDRSKTTGFLPKETESVIVMHLEDTDVKHYSKTVVEAAGYEVTSKQPVKVVWFNQEYIYHRIQSLIGEDVFVCGRANYIEPSIYSSGYFQIAGPTVFSIHDPKEYRIYPVYKKIKNMSAEYLENSIADAAAALYPFTETLSEPILREMKMVGTPEMVYSLHWPASSEALESALRRKRFNDLLLYFALRIELNRRYTAVGSTFNLPMLKTMKKVQSELPFELTEDQQKALDDAISHIRKGYRLNALVQGDVGCGKTIVASLLMIAFAENGYQAALMAPTQLLATQHYEYLKSMVEPYGLKVAFVSGTKLKGKEQKALEAGLSGGEYHLIVGTQALLSQNYLFKNLALVIEDEEHKYGVLQRKALVDKAANGTHTVTMTATPIPRTLAQIVYGDDLQLFQIRTKPSGRKPVKTGIAVSMERVFTYVMDEVCRKKHQIYVLCPMVAANEKMEGVASAEEIHKIYSDALKDKGITTGVITGKTKKAEAEEILKKFETGEISVLVSTTVIEVGINVPNATGIVIHNAERFGLAQLHQLRGRVGRGKDASACVLVTEDRNNERLAALCQYNDGFKISEMDLMQRGAGDLIGSQQSGTEKYLSLALAYPGEYDTAKAIGKRLLDSHEGCSLLEKAIFDFREFEAKTAGK